MSGSSHAIKLADEAGPYHHQVHRAVAWSMAVMQNQSEGHDAVMTACQRVNGTAADHVTLLSAAQKNGFEDAVVNEVSANGLTSALDRFDEITRHAPGTLLISTGALTVALVGELWKGYYLVDATRGQVLSANSVLFSLEEYLFGESDGLIRPSVSLVLMQQGSHSVAQVQPLNNPKDKEEDTGLKMEQPTPAPEKEEEEEEKEKEEEGELAATPKSHKKRKTVDEKTDKPRKRRGRRSKDKDNA